MPDELSMRNQLMESVLQFQFMNKYKKDNIETSPFPVTKECHCMSTADKYTTRKFINQNGNKVIRIFYRCRNCWSRIHEDFIPEIDNLSQVDVIELLKSYR